MQFKKSRAVALMAVIVAAAIGVACGGGAGKTEGPKKLRFALIPKALDIPVFTYANKGAQRAAAELGNVEVIYYGPDHADQLKQKPFKIIADLMELGTFANLNQPLSFQTVCQVVRKYGYTAKRLP